MKVQGGFLEGLGDLEGLGKGFWRVFGGFWGGWPGECLKGSGRVFRFFLVNQSLGDMHYYNHKGPPRKQKTKAPSGFEDG